MDRKHDFEAEDEEEAIMVQISNITVKGDVHHHYDDDDDSLDILKKEISCHSLYGLLVESHLDCLKICLGNMENMEINVINPTALPNQYPNLITADHQSELDQFMEAYCMSLNKVKEVMEEPQQESMAFIKLMYSQLDELLLDFPSSSALSAISSSSKIK